MVNVGSLAADQSLTPTPGANGKQGPIPGIYEGRAHGNTVRSYQESLSSPVTHSLQETGFKDLSIGR